MKPKPKAHKPQAATTAFKSEVEAQEAVALGLVGKILRDFKISYPYIFPTGPGFLTWEQFVGPRPRIEVVNWMKVHKELVDKGYTPPMDKSSRDMHFHFGGVCHCVLSICALDEGNIDFALDMAVAAARVQGLINWPLDNMIKRGVAKKGSKVRVSKIERLKAEAVRLYDERTWRSTKAAAESIHMQVRLFGIKHDIHTLVGTNAERTVYEWLLAHVKSKEQHGSKAT